MPVRNHYAFSITAVVPGEHLGVRIVRKHCRHRAGLCRGSAGVSARRRQILPHSGTDLPFRDGSFNVVMASDVLEHIESDGEAVAEIARVLRPGGSAILSVPAHGWLFSQHDTALQHFRRYSKRAVRELLERNRLLVHRLSYWNPLCSRHLHTALIGKLRTGQPRSDAVLPPGCSTKRSQRSWQ